MILILLLVTLVTLIASVTMSIINFSTSTQKIIRDSFEIQGKNLKDEILTFMENKIDIATVISENSVVENYVQQGNEYIKEKGYNNLSIEEVEDIYKEDKSMNIGQDMKDLFIEFIDEFQEITEVFVTDVNGFNVNVSNPTSDFVQSDEDWWKNAFNEGLFIEDLEYDESAGEVVFSICISVQHPVTKKPNGVLKMAINFSQINHALENSRMGSTGETYLVNKDKIMLNESRFIDELIQEGYVEETAILNLKVDTYGVNQALAGKSGFAFYNDYRGAEIAGYYIPIEEYDWALFLEQDSNEVNSELYNFVIIMVIFGAVILIISIIVAIIFSNRIAKPITTISDGFSELAKGKLIENRIKVKSKNEIGLLADSFNSLLDFYEERNEVNKRIAEGDLTVDVTLASDEDEVGQSLKNMVESLNNIISQIDSSVDQITAGSNQVAESTQSLSAGSSQQASSIEEITASVSQVDTQANKNVEYAKQSDTLAKTAKDNAEKGNQQMEDLVKAMDKINASSNDIKDIIKVIDDIAFQTNLLALNADIEAARVGKYGRGFAVVANSVRTLAGKSGNAVKETAERIEDAINNIEKGNLLVEKTSSQLKDIEQSILELRDIVDEVARGSEEQANGIAQINTGLGQIEDVVQSNSANAEENAAASEELSAQSNKLKQLIRYFNYDKQQKMISKEKRADTKELTIKEEE